MSEDKIGQLKAAIEVCENERQKFRVLHKASPIELSIYNAFTSAKNQLTSTLACVEDALDIYNKEKPR